MQVTNLTRIISIFVFVFGVGMGVNAERESAREVVEQATNELLAKLKEIQPLYEDDKEKFFDEVEASVDPFIDFEGFARGVMAKYYRRATDEQKQRFVSKFKDSLVRTYGDVLVGFDGQEVKVLDGAEDSVREDRASVNLEIKGTSGEIYPVTYTMVYTDSGWKLRNITVEGINIGLQFRSQFSSYMQEHGNDIEKVIENWDIDDADDA